MYQYILNIGRALAQVRQVVKGIETCLGALFWYLILMLIIGGDAQSINREEKEVDAYVEGYIAFMRQCKYNLK